MHQLTTPIPEPVPLPKFHLFQQVWYGESQGIITGMSYTCPLEALREGTSYGWFFTLSFIFGKTVLEAHAADSSDIAVREERLSLEKVEKLCRCKK